MAILSSAVLSTSGVFFALLITRTTFNVSSFMGLIMVIGIVAKNGILLLDANQKFRSVGFSAEEALIQAGPPPPAPHRDDGHGRRRGHVAAVSRPGRGLADAAAAGHRGDRRHPDFHGACR